MHILTTEWFDKKGMIELDGHLYHNLNWHLVMVSVLLTQREKCKKNWWVRFVVVDYFAIDFLFSQSVVHGFGKLMFRLYLVIFIREIAIFGREEK